MLVSAYVRWSPIASTRVSSLNPAPLFLLFGNWDRLVDLSVRTALDDIDRLATHAISAGTKRVPMMNAIAPFTG